MYFCVMESNRQRKVAGVLQNDLATVLQKALKDAGNAHILISVTKVSVTTDLSIAKVFVSVFPSVNGPEIITEIKESQLHQLTNVLKIPDLGICAGKLDESLHGPIIPEFVQTRV